MSATQSPTPRTDAEEIRLNTVDAFDDRRTVPADFARRLERELAEAKDRHAYDKECLQAVESERDQLRAEVEAIRRADRLVEHDLLALLQRCQTGEASCQFTKQAIERVMAKQTATRDEALKVAREALKRISKPALGGKAQQADAAPPSPASTN